MLTTAAYLTVKKLLIDKLWHCEAEGARSQQGSGANDPAWQLAFSTRLPDQSYVAGLSEGQGPISTRKGSLLHTSPCTLVLAGL